MGSTEIEGTIENHGSKDLYEKYSHVDVSKLPCQIQNVLNKGMNLTDLLWEGKSFSQGRFLDVGENLFKF